MPLLLLLLPADWSALSLPFWWKFTTATPPGSAGVLHATTAPSPSSKALLLSLPLPAEEEGHCGSAESTTTLPSCCGPTLDEDEIELEVEEEDARMASGATRCRRPLSIWTRMAVGRDPHKEVNHRCFPLEVQHASGKLLGHQ